MALLSPRVFAFGAFLFARRDGRSTDWIAAPSGECVHGFCPDGGRVDAYSTGGSYGDGELNECRFNARDPVCVARPPVPPFPLVFGWK